MKSRGVRVLVALLAAAALAAAGAAVWRIEQRIAAGQSAADAFERDARQAAAGLGDLRAAQFALVAHGQPADPWLAKSAALKESIAPKLDALHAAALSAEGQGTLESAIEAFTAFSGQDARAREYLRAGQVLSASDAVFGSGAPLLDRVAGGLDTARSQESIARAIAVADARKWQLVWAGAGLAVILAALLLLVPIPRGASPEPPVEAFEGAADGGLGLSRPADGFARGVAADASLPGPGTQEARSGFAAAGAPEHGAAAEAAGNVKSGARPRADLAAIADVCSSLARVQYSSELPSLLERTAKALDATGVIVWMPDSRTGLLRPALSHGYAPAALARMGGIQPAADNATAVAFRTKSVVAVEPDALAGGAVVAPLHTAEGCSGALAVELADGIEPGPHVRAGVAIVAAQLATLLTPASADPASGPPPSAAPRPGDVPGARKD